MRTATAIIAIALAVVVARRRDTPARDDRDRNESVALWPTRRTIDKARGKRVPAGAEFAFTDALEQRARELTDEFWSDIAWMTGSIAPEPLAAVIDVLDREGAESILDPRRFHGRLPDC